MLFLKMTEGAFDRSTDGMDSSYCGAAVKTFGLCSVKPIMCNESQEHVRTFPTFLCPLTLGSLDKLDKPGFVCKIRHFQPLILPKLCYCNAP